MLVRFWGTRGSLPASMKAKHVRARLREALVLAKGKDLGSDAALESFIDGLPFAVRGGYGGDSSCVQIDTGTDEYLVCDLGSGVRAFGNYVLHKDGFQKKNVFHVVMSHMHWDHIMGFPFFVPAYVPGNRVRIYGCHGNMETQLRQQHDSPSFPVNFEMLGADIEFVSVKPGEPVEICGATARAIDQLHEGESFGWRFEKDGKSLVYATDAEYKIDNEDQARPTVEFFRDADLVIFDSMYSLAEAVSLKEDWGHSSNVVGVELCHMANVRHLCLFHHEPINDDAAIDRILRETVRYEEISRTGAALKVSAAYDGMEVRL